MKKKVFGWVAMSFLISLLIACATKPDMKTDDVNLKITPADALQHFSESMNQKVLWGGSIVSVQNLKKGTMLEILAYPITRDYKPNTEKKPLGRFLAKHPDYLEAVNYSPGRFVSLTGTLSEIVDSKIGEAEYHYPLIDVEQMHLWPLSSQSDSRFHFGLGVMIHN